MGAESHSLFLVFLVYKIPCLTAYRWALDARLWPHSLTPPLDTTTEGKKSDPDQKVAPCT